MLVGSYINALYEFCKKSKKNWRILFLKIFFVADLFIHWYRTVLFCTCHFSAHGWLLSCVSFMTDRSSSIKTLSLTGVDVLIVVAVGSLLMAMMIHPQCFPEALWICFSVLFLFSDNLLYCTLCSDPFFGNLHSIVFAVLVLLPLCFTWIGP